MIRPASPQTAERGKLELTALKMPPLNGDEVVVEIAGCGVCHTDLSYFYYGVPTVNKPPLTLGHEISGTVVAGPEERIGQEVIVPAVQPCGNCPICASGRGNRCLGQKMPGNSMGPYGGYSSHIVVPSRDLCVVRHRGVPLSHLSVVADAVTTPYQAAVRGQVQAGDRLIVVGCGGGVGVYMPQIAKALGASTVVGIDIDDQKLKTALSFGVDIVINSRGKKAKEVQAEFRDICKRNDLPHNWGWKIFEVSGSKLGQEIALELISFVSRIVVVGYATERVEFMLSKLMAFDAEIIGTWGCPPSQYPHVLDLVDSGKIQVEPFIEVRPMSEIEAVFEAGHSGKLTRRVILVPDFSRH